MNILHSVGKIINRYGCTAFVENNGERVQIKALVQPIRYKNNEYADLVRLKAGGKKQGLYLLLCAPCGGLEAGKTVIETENGKYIVKRCEAYCVNDSTVYEWAVLCRCTDELEDDYEPN